MESQMQPQQAQIILTSEAINVQLQTNSFLTIVLQLPNSMFHKLVASIFKKLLAQAQCLE